jgi:predicted nuclease of predicted toxin-antitoxin system
MNFLIDSNLPRALATGLANRGHDAVHLADWHGGLYRNAHDPLLLTLAAAEGRAIVTHDLATFPAEAYAILADGHSFAGVLVVTRGIGRADVGRQVTALLTALAEYGSMTDTVIYLRAPDQ